MEINVLSDFVGAHTLNNYIPRRGRPADLFLKALK